MKRSSKRSASSPLLALGMMMIVTGMMAKPATAAPTEKVTGMGGFFFRSTAPATLAQWYADNLGIDLTPTSYQGQAWQQQAGTTIFEPSHANTTYWAANKAFMLNFRVANLDAMVSQLRAAAIAVDVDPQTYPNGRFASLTDPEGNPLQLWEPAATR